MTESTAPKKTAKPRTKHEGPRGYVVRNGDKLRLIQADEIRVATPEDFMKALRGDIPTENAREVVQA